MDNDLRIVDRSNSRFNIKIVTLSNGKSALVWSNKGATAINNVVIIYKNINSDNLTNNQVCVSLDGITDINDIRKSLTYIINYLERDYGINRRKINFTVKVDNKEQLDIAENLLGNNIEVVKTKNYVEEEKKQEEIKKDYQEELRAGGDTKNISSVSKYGTIEKNTLTSDGKLMDDNGVLTNEEEKKILLAKLLNDKQEYKKLASMSFDERDRYLNSMLNKDVRYSTEAYSNNNSLQEDSDNKRSFQTSSGATITTSNGENMVDTTRNYNGEVTKDSTEVEKNSLSVNGENYKSDYQITSDDVKSDKKKIYESNMPDFFIKAQADEYGRLFLEIYDSLGNYIGNNNEDDYAIEMENGIYYLTQNGSKIGKAFPTDDPNLSRDSSNNKSNSKSNVYVRKRELKPDYSSSNRGSVNLPVIIFVISLLLLISSGIILFMMK